MKKLLCVSFSMLLLGNSFAQTSTHRWSAAVNGNYKEYKGDLGKTLLQFRFPNFQVGGGVSRYLNSWIDLSLNANYGKFYHSPTPNIYQEQYPKLNLKGINTNLTARIKFNNGKWIKEDAFLSPYLAVGVGLFYGDRQKPDYTPDWRKVEFINIPVGLGVNIKCSQRMQINLNSTWLPSFDDQLDGYVSGNNWDQLWEHRIGVAYNFNFKKADGEKKESKEKKPAKGKPAAKTTK